MKESVDEGAVEGFGKNTIIGAKPEDSNKTKENLKKYL